MQTTILTAFENALQQQGPNGAGTKAAAELVRRSAIAEFGTHAAVTCNTEHEAGNLLRAIILAEQGRTVGVSTVRRTDSSDGKQRRGDVLRMAVKFSNRDNSGAMDPREVEARDLRNGLATCFRLQGKDKSGSRRVNLRDLSEIRFCGNNIPVRVG